MVKHQGTVGNTPRRFELYRRYDVTGVSGTGTIAFGTLYPTGRVTLAWCCSDVRSVSVYDDVAEVEEIHGHRGLTELRWIDPAPEPEPSRASAKYLAVISSKGNTHV